MARNDQPFEVVFDNEMLQLGYQALGPVSCNKRFQRLLNCRIDRGVIEKRGGYDTLQTGGEMTGSGAVQSMYCTAGTANKVVIATANSRIFSIPKAGGAFTARATGLPDGVRWDHCEFKIAGVTNWIGCNGSGVPHKWDSAAAGTTAMAGQTVDAGVYCNVVMANNGRLWMGKGRTVYVTQLNQPDTYSGATLVIDSDGRQGDLTRLIPRERAQSLWFCERETYLMLGTDPGDQSAMPNIRILDLFEVGAPCGRAVVKVGQEVYFFGVENGRYGFFATDGVEVTCISNIIQDDLDRVNTAHMDKASAVQVGNNVVFALPLDAATEANTLFVYNRSVRGRPWVTWSFTANPRCFARDLATGTVFFGNQATANVQRYTPTTYVDGAAGGIDQDVILPSVGAGMDLSSMGDVEIHSKVVADGSVAVSYGMDEQAVASFTVFPNSPFLTGATGIFDGDAGGVTDYPWMGVARGFLKADGDLMAQSYRIRLRETGAHNCEHHRIRERGNVTKRK